MTNMKGAALVPLIRCENLSFAYEGVVVVHDLNFTVESGDYLCIIGENGAGKSTLMKGLLGLKKPSSGQLLFDDSDGLSPHGIGYLPQQNPLQRDFPATVMEVVQSGCLNRLALRPFYGRREKALAAEKLEQLGLSDLREKSYRDLSGGQQQRVLLARALCATQKLLLLDEPVAGLDPQATLDFYELIEKLNKEEKLTIIMVSHDLQSVLRYASKILQLEKTQRFFGSKETYLQSEQGRAYAHVQGA